MENEYSIADGAERQKFMLLFSGPDWDEGLSNEELQALMDRTDAWFNKLLASGRVKGGQALGRRGKIISGPKGRVVTDGPFAESKEAVGGFLMLEAASLEEAVAIAKGSPGLDHGIRIEVRPALDECPCFKRARERLGLVAAGAC